MALFKFTKGILAGEAIPVFNEGNMIRDFTYIDDIVEGITRVLDEVSQPDPSWSGDAPDPARSYAPYRVFNIGNNQPVHLMNCIQELERCLGIKAKLDLLPMQKGDVPSTRADVTELERAVGFRPQTSIEDGISRFVAWYKDYFQVS
jgi:UDP-glucuronate 4-epimerase